MAAEEELAHLRALDPLTGAGTYSQLKASLDGELARSRRYGRPGGALLFGFDDYQGLRYRSAATAAMNSWPAGPGDPRHPARRPTACSASTATSSWCCCRDRLAGAQGGRRSLGADRRRVDAEGRAGPFDPRSASAERSSPPRRSARAKICCARRTRATGRSWRRGPSGLRL